MLIRAICIAVLIGILVAGLWPFHAPSNQVSWLSNGEGLFFGDFGSIVSASAFRAKQLNAGAPCSLEIWLQARQVDSSGTILAFYWPENLVVRFELRQSLADLAIGHTSLENSRQPRSSLLYVDDLFSRPESIFITISSGPAGTAVYADGTLVKKAENFRISGQDLTGQLIIGNTPATTHNWSGQVRGFAFYDRDLTAAEVSQHYASWAGTGGIDLVENEGAVARYLFNEGKGRVVHNQVDSATNLFIPEKFFVLREQFLVPPWDEFYPDWSYWKDIGINISGFIPLGFFFRAYFSEVRKLKHSAQVTIAMGFAVSLTIEVLQALLPTRNSGMTDLITNTSGTALGVVLYAWSVSIIG